MIVAFQLTARDSGVVTRWTYPRQNRTGTLAEEKGRKQRRWNRIAQWMKKRKEKKRNDAMRFYVIYSAS